MTEADAVGRPLTGGRITAGVVRIADTVRRPPTANSAFVAELLTLLQENGFTGAPRHLGRDDAGRDILGFLPGHVPARFQRWTDGQVAAAAALLRALHDATRGSGLSGGHEVVCHHDPGPNNAVFRDGLPVAFIDFDAAAPGDPLEDVGYLAWTWCISSKPTAPAPEAQAAQVRVVADAYGLDGPGRIELIDAVLDRQARNARWWAGRPRAIAQDDGVIAERVAWSWREHAYTVANRGVFTAALDGDGAGPR